MDILHYLQARLNLKSERGAALVEYALLLALIAVVCIVAIGVIGSEANKEFDQIAKSISK
jgi:pilus assembly protein Flp/PilA